MNHDKLHMLMSLYAGKRSIRDCFASQEIGLVMKLYVVLDSNSMNALKMLWTVSSSFSISLINA
jgi:hypothetical protein